MGVSSLGGVPVSTQYRSFSDFYPYYLAEHRKPATRRLHFIGTLLVILTVVYAIAMQRWGLLVLAPVFGYGLAWIGHFVFEKNRPATFEHPLYSLAGDFVMFKDLLMGRIPF
jgi:hypothetical protein